MQTCLVFPHWGVLELNRGLVGLQVDKGTAGLNGTDGETTTQGTFYFIFLFASYFGPCDSKLLLHRS